MCGGPDSFIIQVYIYGNVCCKRKVGGTPLCYMPDEHDQFRTSHNLFKPEHCSDQFINHTITNYKKYFSTY